MSSIEFILPSGKFATLRDLTALDVICAVNGANHMHSMSILASRCVSIEGAELSQEDVANMLWEDASVVFNMISKQLNKSAATASRMS